MFAPLRFLYSTRPTASAGVLGAAALTAALFAATPFMIPEVASGYGVSIGIAGALSTMQVGAFAITAFLAGRLLTASARLLKAAVAIFLVANVLSALGLPFWGLGVMRALVGAAAGVSTWVAWSDAMSQPRGLGDVSMVGPFTALVVSPVLGFAAYLGGDRGLFLALGVIAVPVLFLPAVVAGSRMRRHRVSGSRSNRLLLVAMGLLTLAGSSLFVYAVGAASLAGLGLVAASWGYSINALAGMVATRLRPRRLGGAVWLGGTAVSAAMVALVHSPVVFYAAMAFWGFAFWMAIPEVFRMLARRSLIPEERVGDAQAIMAVGRAIGPLVGGALLAVGSFDLLGIVASGGLLIGALIVGAVEARRRAGEPAREGAGLAPSSLLPEPAAGPRR